MDHSYFGQPQPTIFAEKDHVCVRKLFASDHEYPTSFILH